MALETAATINQLVATNPPNSDPVAEAAAHLRLLKAALQATFPNLTGPVTVSHTELNYLQGLASSLVTQLAAEITARQNADALKADKAGATFTGAVLLPAQGANPDEAARKDYVDAAALSSTLPGQAGNAGKLITTDGSSAGWTAIKTVAGQPLLGSGDLSNVATLGANTFSGTQSLGGNVVAQPALAATLELRATASIASGTLTLDLYNGITSASLNANITTLSLVNNLATSGRCQSHTLELTADGTPRTVAWPAGDGTSTLKFNWPGGVVPTLTSANGKRDTFFFKSVSQFLWDAYTVGQNQ